MHFFISGSLNSLAVVKNNGRIIMVMIVFLLFQFYVGNIVTKKVIVYVQDIWYVQCCFKISSFSFFVCFVQFFVQF